MNERSYNVLFLCTGNSARSILAEAILRKDGAGRFNAFSAGSHPKGVNPVAVKVLESLEYPIDRLRSKGWHEFAGPHVPAMDFVFTLCNSAAREACPIWPGKPVAAHWGVEDPAAVQGSAAQKEAAFVAAARRIAMRISAFVDTPIDSLDSASLSARLREIGALEGATKEVA
jgi:arsenate reductase